MERRRSVYVCVCLCVCVCLLVSCSLWCLLSCLLSIVSSMIAMAATGMQRARQNPKWPTAAPGPGAPLTQYAVLLLNGPAMQHTILLCASLMCYRVDTFMSPSVLNSWSVGLGPAVVGLSARAWLGGAWGRTLAGNGSLGAGYVRRW